MAVNMDELLIGESYDRNMLASMWKYNGRQGLSRGIITPANDNKIILFVTKIKQKSDIQYNDYFIDDSLLHMEGETSHTNDKRMVNAALLNESIYLFYRDIHHTQFTYYGEIYLVEFKLYIEKPSIFIFALTENFKKSSSSLIVDYTKTGLVYNDFIADVEGLGKVKEHLVYERSIKNRAKAIEIHGTVCKACGFDFNSFYGKELADSFIEIHHIKALGLTGRATVTDPEFDLVPLCSNCHSMVHRKRDSVLTIEKLRSLINKNSNCLRFPDLK